MDAERHRRWSDRHRSSTPIPLPSAFVAQCLTILRADDARPRRALDVACGRGRHALLLAEQGYRVTAVDYALPAVRSLQVTARARGLAVDCLAADVTTWPFPRQHWDLVVVVNFLERALLEPLRAAVVPRGALLIETFVMDGHDGVPAAFRLHSGELDERFRDWEIVARHATTDMHDGRPTPRAGILARRPLADGAH